MLLFVIARSEFIQINASNQNLTNQAGPLFVKFYMDDCVPCRTLNVTWYQQEAFAHLPMLDVNCGQFMPLCRRLKVQVVPTVVFATRGIPVSSRTGLLTKEDLTEFLTKATTPLQATNTFETVDEAVKAKQSSPISYIYEGLAVNETMWLKYKTEISFAFVKAKQEKLTCIRNGLNISITNITAATLKRFIEHYQRSWLERANGDNLYELRRKSESLPLLVVRESRDYDQVRALERFVTAMELNILQTDEAFAKRYATLKDSFDFAFLDTQEYYYFVEQFGIKKTFQKPVFVLQRANNYSKRELLDNLTSKLQISYRENATSYKLLLNLTNDSYEVPSIAIQFLDFLQDEKDHKLQKINYKKDKKMVKIGKDQEYTPPSEGLFEKIIYLWASTKKDSKELKSGVAIICSAMIVVMILTCWIFRVQTVI